MNPFFAPSPLPYEAPPFDQITDADYEPALLEGMRAQRAEIDAIASQADPPTFDNTLVAMEWSGALLTRAYSAFSAMTSANTSETLQKVQEDLAPKLADHHDSIYLSAPLFKRVEAVHGQRASLDAESKRLVEHYHRIFVRSGARLSEPDKEALRALNGEESSLQARFEKALLGATKGGALVTSEPTALAGLSEGELAAAALAAKERKLDAGWVIPLQNTTQQPAQVSLRDRTTRQRLFELSTRRAERGDENDTRALAQRLAQLRATKARLLGFETYAAYALADQMAGTPEKATRLLTDLVPAAVSKARGEASRMRALASQQAGGDVELRPWDWQFYAEQVRRAEYSIDDEKVKPYLELDRVLKDGVFFAAARLYGISFVERRDLPVYQSDVRVFEVFEESGAPLGLFYADYFERANKAGGAWMNSFVDASKLTGKRPVVANTCNFTKPAPGQPALLGFDEVRTLFHEFGHALHGLFSATRFPTLGGTNVPRDFVELPSQINEHWASDPAVFANYAKHYQTGAPMPADLVARIERARQFNQGFTTTEYLAAALLDMAWHSLPDGAPAADIDAFEAEALRRHGADFPLVPPRYRTTYFAHIWAGGYAARYYAYLWSEVLDHDAFHWFQENGGLTRANGDRFREMILSKGDTRELSSMYREFRGRDPSVQPLLDHRGLGAETTAPVD